MHTSEWRVEPGNPATWTKVMRGGLTADDGLEIVAKTYAIEGHTATDVARLIAAAPELLSCCQRLLEIVEAEYEADPEPEDLDTWRAAIQLAVDCIAKAEGRDE